MWKKFSQKINKIIKPPSEPDLASTIKNMTTEKLQNAPEAREWITNNRNGLPFATNRFSTKANALDFVEKLYKLGAVRVTIDPHNIYQEEWRIAREGGPYAAALYVELPNDNPESRFALIKVDDEEARAELGENRGDTPDTGQKLLWMWWD